MHSDYHIRPAEPGDIPSLARIELDAAAQFRELGFEGDYIGEVEDPQNHADAQREGRLWVAVRGAEIAGFALAIVLGDGEAWLDEIDVHPSHGRRGIGRALVETVMAWARALPSPSLGLSTFRHVPWNAPFYAKLGFREIAPVNYSASIREIIADEASRGLPLDERLAMRLLLDDRS